MKKLLILITLMLSTIFVLSSCQVGEIPVEEVETYNVIYYIEENNAYKAASYDEDELVTEPNDPSKVYYEFQYWTLNNSEFTFDNTIENDVQLYAKWIRKTIEVSLYNESNLLDLIEVDVESDASSIIGILPVMDDTFIGWYLDQTFSNELDSSDEINGDISLYGRWEIEDEIDPINELVITEDGLYISKDEVALYIATYYKLPSNYMTKSEAGGHISSLWTSTNKASIGGDTFGNREGLLPSKSGRTFIELDIDYSGGRRGAKRIVYSSDFRIFYTYDHYDSFVEYDKETREWKSY